MAWAPRTVLSVITSPLAGGSSGPQSTAVHIQVGEMGGNEVGIESESR